MFLIKPPQYTVFIDVLRFFIFKRAIPAPEHTADQVSQEYLRSALHIFVVRHFAAAFVVEPKPPTLR